MARAAEETHRSASSPLTEYERMHLIRHFPVEKDRRYHQLVERQALGTLTAAERAELQRLVDEAEQLSIENARALLRHRDPSAFAALQKRADATGRPSRSTSARSQHA